MARGRIRRLSCLRHDGDKPRAPSRRRLHREALAFVPPQGSCPTMFCLNRHRRGPSRNDLVHVPRSRLLRLRCIDRALASCVPLDSAFRLSRKRRLLIPRYGAWTIGQQRIEVVRRTVHSDAPNSRQPILGPSCNVDPQRSSCRCLLASSSARWRLCRQHCRVSSLGPVPYWPTNLG